jgi:predicted  nucleic acid-binding Zn-ribbon protein
VTQKKLIKKNNQSKWVGLNAYCRALAKENESLKSQLEKIKDDYKKLTDKISSLKDEIK